DGVAVRRAAGGHGDIPAGRDDAVEGGAVHHQVLHHGEGFGAPRFEVEFVAVLEVAHVELAQGGAGQRAMGHAVHHAAAHAADAFAAIVVERHGLFVLADQVLVQHVQHFEERHFVVDVGYVIAHHLARIVGVALPPDVKNDSHYL